MLRVTIVLSFLLPFLIWSQNSYYLAFNAPTSEYVKTKSKKFSSKEELQKELQKLQYKYIRKGYVLTSLDEVKWSNDTAYASLFIGELFKNIEIQYTEEDSYVLKRVPKINERLMVNFPFKPYEVSKLLQGISSYLNNNGYPFSKVFLTVEKIDYIQSIMRLNIEKGPLIQISKVHLKGESKLKEKYVQNIISIKEGDSYNAELLRNISNRIDQVQFVKEIKKHEILFQPDGAELFLYLENVPVSLVNGIVGIQPNPVTNKTSVTGDVRLKLLNLLKHGEELDINWKSLQPATQELKLKLSYPFLFNTPFGIDTRFNLYKQDSSYMTLEARAGVQYFFSGGSYLKAFYHFTNSSLLSATSSTLSNNFSNVTNNSYGLGFFWNKVDYLPNPSKGMTIDVEALAGRRQSRDAVHDTIEKATVFTGSLEASFYLPITPRHVIRLSNISKSYYAPTIFQNELYRFGGLNSQRGFNEETLLASTLTIFGLEYRFLTDRDSHAFLFYDQTVYENNASKYIQDYPFGFGVGYSFGTKIGIFSISYALGKQMGNPIEIKNGKVHFGYIAYF